MFDAMLWWLAVSAVGWLAWPLAARIFRNSPGYGYAFCRPIGLIGLTYCFWLLSIVGLLPNTLAALWILVGVLAIPLLILGWRSVGKVSFWRPIWRHVLTVEALSFVGYSLYLALRVHVPVIDHTEQPMDFALLNGILRSPRMPPRDPWLSGSSISYYYMGYLMAAILARLTGIPAGIAYNLSLAHTFALALGGAYGVLHSLTSRPLATRCSAVSILFSLAGAWAIVAAGNLEGLIELLSALGLGSEGLYRWLGVPGLSKTLAPDTWLPGNGWWWWRASRVIHDQNLLGRNPTIITEFPAFSFILGDLHPHLITLPFVLLALGLAVEWHRAGHSSLSKGWWRQARFLSAPLLLGALGFLNSWDLPTFAMVGIVAFAFGRWRRGGAWLRDCLLFGVLLIVGSVGLYAPFYAQLQTQVQGIGLVYYAKTPLPQYLLCFGLWLLPIAGGALEGLHWQRGGEGENAPRWPFFAIWAGLLIAPWLITLLAGGWGRLLLGLVALSTSGPWLTLLQSGLLALLLFGLLRLSQQQGCHIDTTQVFAGMLAIVGISLTYGVEFFYLRDTFDTRMNTVFKLYYQAWVLLGSAAILFIHRFALRGRWWRALAVTAAAVACLGMHYPIAAAASRASEYHTELTLDGTAFLRHDTPDAHALYLWLDEHAVPDDVLAEAAGESYRPTSSWLSGWTGVPSVLGWAGHEIQWRGGTDEVLRRGADLETIYMHQDARYVQRTLQHYGVTYLLLGPEERLRYSSGTERAEWFATFLELVFVQGEYRLYRVIGTDAGAGAEVPYILHSKKTPPAQLGDVSRSMNSQATEE